MPGDKKKTAKTSTRENQSLLFAVKQARCPQACFFIQIVYLLLIRVNIYP